MLLHDWRLQIATRYSASSRSDQLLSFVSLVSIAGLVLGVAVLVIVLSVMNGFEKELRTRVLGVVPHGVIYSRSADVDWHSLQEKWEGVPGVLATAPLIEGTGLALANGVLTGVRFTGIDPVLEKEVSIVDEYMLEGSLATLVSGTFNVVIGSGIAGRLQVRTGDRITMILPELSIGLAGPRPVMKRLRVSGIYHVGSDIDKSHLYLHLDDAMKLNRQHSIDGLRVRMKDLFDAPVILQEMIYSSGRHDLQGLTWMKRHGNLYDAIQMQKTTMFLLLLILVGVAAFNVVSNLMMVVQDKRADIAILRTIGASPTSVRTIFIVHGCIIGLVGVSTGIVSGVLLSHALGDIYGFLDAVFELGLMDEYFIQYLPVEVRFADMALVAMLSFTICVMATIYPASRAANASPAEALQYDK